MSILAHWFDIGFTPLVLSASDLVLFYYLCEGNRAYIRKHRLWGLWFSLVLLVMAVTQYLINGQTGQNSNIYIFFGSRFVYLLLFSALCTDVARSARAYLSILILLSSDICLISFVRISRLAFSVDYLVVGPYIIRLLAHALLLGLKTGVTVFMRKQIEPEVFGIQSAYQATIIMLPALPYFYMRDYIYLFSIPPANVPWSIHFVTSLCGICALVNMLVSERLSYHIRQNDVLRMEHLIRKQQNQYQLSQNAIEAVNRKYHDLRHIARGIDSMQDIDEIKAFIHKIEGDIIDYELICNTGNRTLDIILSERMRECKRTDLHMHVHADGQGWDLIRDMDVATIFGNALDNAIESVRGIQEDALRLIEVRIGRVNDMLIARFENPFTHPLEKKQAQYLSTKSDKRNHGYGLRSIALTVKQYGGEIDIKADNGRFALTVIIPIPQSQAEEKTGLALGQNP